MSEATTVSGKRIVVLMGGLSAERDVSLRTGNAVLKALLESGCNAVGLDAGIDLPARLKELDAEIAFISLHGRYGEDGTVQGLLEMLQIPYTVITSYSIHYTKLYEASLSRRRSAFRKEDISCSEPLWG